MPNTALNRTTQALLTNKSGGALVYGDVVVLDNTNASSFTTTTSAGLSTRGLGVILEPNGIANNASGMVAIGGWCPKVNLNTAATVGQFIKTHTVAGQGTPHSSPQVEGDFGVALDASATPSAILFGSPNGPSASTGTVTNTGTLTSGTLIQGNGTVDVTVNATTAAVTKLTAGVPSAATDGVDYLSPATGFTRLSQIVTAASQATVDFTSISGSYTTLQVVFSSQDTAAGTATSAVRLKINNDGTAGNYSSTARNGSEAGSAFSNLVAPSTSGQWVTIQPNAGNTARAGNGCLFIASYAGTTFHKRWTATTSWSSTTSGDGVAISEGVWANTAAITRLTFSTDGTAFTNGSIFTLYGLP